MGAYPQDMVYPDRSSTAWRVGLTLIKLTAVPGSKVSHEQRCLKSFPRVVFA